LDGELDVLVGFVEAIGVSMGVSMSAGVDSIELAGDICLSIGVDGGMDSSSSGGCGRFSKGTVDVGDVSAWAGILRL
jgi:hypothetical protein